MHGPARDRLDDASTPNAFARVPTWADLLREVAEEDADHDERNTRNKCDEGESDSKRHTLSLLPETHGEVHDRDRHTDGTEADEGRRPSTDRRQVDESTADRQEVSAYTEPGQVSFEPAGVGRTSRRRQETGRSQSASKCRLRQPSGIQIWPCRTADCQLSRDSRLHRGRVFRIECAAADGGRHRRHERGRRQVVPRRRTQARGQRHGQST